MSPTLDIGDKQVTVRFLRYICIAACLLTLCNGCATVAFMTAGREEIVNEKNPPLWPVYTRTHFDLWMMYFPVWAFTPANDGKGDNAYATTFAILFGPFMLAGGAVDLPLSLVIDTVTLPRDLRNRHGDTAKPGESPSGKETDSQEAEISDTKNNPNVCPADK